MRSFGKQVRNIWTHPATEREQRLIYDVLRMKRGRFITFEGLDGCGKSTQLQRLAASLRRAGHSVVVTREPGGTHIGEKVRSVLLDSRTKGLAPRAEAALMFASRAQQIQQVILPAVREGKWVLCDRYTDSSEAYQGAGRGLGVDTIHMLHEAICEGLQPDLTILLLSGLRTSILGVTRARSRNNRMKTSGKGDEGRFESEKNAFYGRVYRAYQHIAKRDAKRVARIEALRTIDEVHADILETVQERLGVSL